MESKVCTRCKVEKPCAEFAIRRDRPMGLVSACKGCANKITSAYRLDNIEKVRQQGVDSYKRNREEIRKKEKIRYWSDPVKARLAARISGKKRTKQRSEYNKRYRVKNRNHLRAVHKKYYADNFERLRLLALEYNKRNKNKKALYMKGYYQNNKEERDNYNRIKGKEDGKNLKGWHVRKALVNQGWPKEGITPDLIEYKRADLKLYRALKGKCG